MDINKPTHARSIVVKDSKLLVMWRFKKGLNYFVLPGGHIEKNESPIDAVKREAMEETSVDVNPQKLLYRHCDHLTATYFYLCDYQRGEPELPSQSEEANRSSAENFYRPAWAGIHEVQDYFCYPTDVMKQIITDWRNQNWPTETVDIISK